LFTRPSEATCMTMTHGDPVMARQDSMPECVAT